MMNDDHRDDILSETDRLSAEAHVAVAKSLIVLEEVRALRNRDDPDPDAVYSAITTRQLKLIDDAPEQPAATPDRGPAAAR